MNCIINSFKKIKNPCKECIVQACCVYCCGEQIEYDFNKMNQKHDRVLAFLIFLIPGYIIAGISGML